MVGHPLETVCKDKEGETGIDLGLVALVLFQNSGVATCLLVYECHCVQWFEKDMGGWCDEEEWWRD